jgi:thiol-disulfide isomerase/thioredoxin
MDPRRKFLRAKTALVIALATAWLAPAGAVEVGSRAPAWQAISFEGKSVSFPQFVAGKPTIVIFWASWCNYCKAFMPHLNEIQKEYGADLIEIVAVNFGEEKGAGSDPDAYIKNTGIALTAIRAGEDIAAAYGVKVIPGLMVVDSSGTVTYRAGMRKPPAGKPIAELWNEQVRAALEADLAVGCDPQ